MAQQAGSDSPLMPAAPSRPYSPRASKSPYSLNDAVGSTSRPNAGLRVAHDRGEARALAVINKAIFRAESARSAHENIEDGEQDSVSFDVKACVLLAKARRAQETAASTEG